MNFLLKLTSSLALAWSMFVPLRGLEKRPAPQSLISETSTSFLDSTGPSEKVSPSNVFFKSSSSCDNWLYLPTNPSFCSIGDLDVPGQALTVEANFNRTTIWNGSLLFQGDLVSKHEGEHDVNYLLRPSCAEITTTNGYFRTPDVCPPELNKNYHVAMVYDGSTLKFYRNGFLMSQIPAFGDLVQNDWPARIGFYFHGVIPENFVGYISEVRIWKAVRSQSQIRAFMNTSLPAPKSQPGLQAYYTFDDLINKQGNVSWNGKLGGSALVHQINSTCSFAADSCKAREENISCAKQFSIGSDRMEAASDVVAAQNGEFFVAGTQISTDNTDLLITKISPSGKVIWAKTYGGSKNESVRKIKLTSDGGILLVGQTQTDANTSPSILVMRLTSSGTLVWSNELNQTTTHGELGMDIIETTDGGFALTGIRDVFGGVADGLVIKLDGMGRQRWTRVFDHGGSDDAVGLVQKGDTLIACIDNQNTQAQYTIVVSKMALADGKLYSSKMLTASHKGVFNPYIFLDPVRPGYIISGHNIQTADYSDMQHVIIFLDESLNVTDNKVISLERRTNDFSTGFVALGDGSLLGCASPQINAEGYVYKIARDNTIEFSKKFTSAYPLRLSRMVENDEDITAVGTNFLSGNQNFFVTTFGKNGTFTKSCAVENTPLSVDQISFSAVDYTWPSSSIIQLTEKPLSFPMPDFVVTTENLCSSLPLDFGFSRSACNPLVVQFFTQPTSSFQWDFGNDQRNSHDTFPIVAYDTAQVYQVKLASLDGGCASVAKTLDLSLVRNNNLVSANDTAICPGDSIELSHFDGHTDCWHSNSGQVLTSKVSPKLSTTYFLNHVDHNANLLSNPGFESGDAGFKSSYNRTPLATAKGQFGIAASSEAWGLTGSACGAKAGNAMIIRAAGRDGDTLWSQTVAVSANQAYEFSGWFQALEKNSPAHFKIRINGFNITGERQTSDSVCNWIRESVYWNSGESTVANLSIICTDTIERLFSLDDLYFGITAHQTDSLRVTVRGQDCSQMKIVGPGKVCLYGANTVYRVERSPTCQSPFSVSFDPSFGEVVSQDQSSFTVRFQKDGSTHIKAMLSNGCEIRWDSLKVEIKRSPTTVDLGPDREICGSAPVLLDAGPGFESYSWQNGSVEQQLNVQGEGMQLIKATNFCGQVAIDTAVIVRGGIVPFTLKAATYDVCADSVNFFAAGGNRYEWLPVEKFINQTPSRATAWIDSSQTLSVHIYDDICHTDSMMTATVTSHRVEPSIIKTNDVNCSLDSATLTASGGEVYTWRAHPSIVRANGAHVLVRPDVTTTYMVSIQNAFGCKASDTITVGFNPVGLQKLNMPTAFTPNGDGLNDFYRPLFTGPYLKYEFRIYNRWGQLVFRSSKPGQGWNGNINSQPAPKDVYVYYLLATGVCAGANELKGTFLLIR